MNVNPVHGMLAIALLMSLGTYAFVIRPLESAIGARYADVETARSLLQRDLAFVQRRPALERERERVRAEIGGLRLRASRTAIVDRFLRRLARITAAGTVSVASIAGEPAHTTSGATLPGAVPALLDEQSLDVGVLGAYGDVLRAVRDLNDGDVATQIAISSIGNVERRAGKRARLHATLHVTLLRETDAASARAS